MGIDQSVNHTGICILNKQREVVFLDLVEPSKSLREEKRLGFIRDNITKALENFEVTTLVMEGYSYNSANKKFLLGEVGSIVKLLAYDMDADLFSAAPKQLKKFVSGRGSASKQQMINCIDKQWGLKVTNDNLADAFGLACIAHEITWPQSTKRHQLDVVKLITKKSLKPKRARSIKLVPNAI